MAHVSSFAYYLSCDTCGNYQDTCVTYRSFGKAHACIILKCHTFQHYAIHMHASLLLTSDISIPLELVTIYAIGPKQSLISLTKRYSGPSHHTQSRRCLRSVMPSTTSVNWRHVIIYNKYTVSHIDDCMADAPDLISKTLFRRVFFSFVHISGVAS